MGCGAFGFPFVVIVTHFFFVTILEKPKTRCLWSYRNYYIETISNAAWETRPMNNTIEDMDRSKCLKNFVFPYLRAIFNHEHVQGSPLFPSPRYVRHGPGIVLA